MIETAHTRLLLVDDEVALREPLAEYLQRQGFVVVEVNNAAEARILLASDTFDLLLLDVMMPGEDGLSLCRYIVEHLHLPTILLTARSEATDRIVGLEMGADDYLAKPFEPRELVARIRSVLRRANRIPPASNPDIQHASDNALYIFDGWKLDETKRRLTDPEGAFISISSAELRLLLAFVQSPRKVLDRETLHAIVQGREAPLFDRTVDNLVSRLRRKMEADNRNPLLIQTVWGGGYRFSAEVQRHPL